MIENNPVSEQKNNPAIFVVLNFTLVSLMLTCVAFILGRLFQLFSDGWQPQGFAVLAFLVALESLILRYSQREQSKVLYNHLLYTLTEIIFIVLIVKIFSIALDPTTHIVEEVSSWSNNFFQSFFDGNTILRTLGIFTIWAFSWLFSFPLNELKEDQDLLAQEKLGHTFTDRYEARRGLIRLVFVIGFFMLLALGILNNVLAFVPSQASTDHLLSAMLIYFGASFLLLALNHYAIMKARWYLNDIPVNQDLSKQWIVYSLIFIMIVLSIIAFLPTDFTIGFRPIAVVILNILVIIWSIIQFLFSIPFILISSQTNTSPESDTLNEIIQQQRPAFDSPITQSSGPIPWVEFIKSIFFWLIFIFVVAFSVYYFIKNKYGFEFFFKKIRVGVWLSDFWQWIKVRFAKFNQTVTETIQNGSEKIQGYFQRRNRDLQSLTDLVKMLPPRQAIIVNYLDWLRWNARNGRERKKSQTPLEYARTCSQINPEAATLIQTFTNVFITARYSKQEITREQSNVSRKLLNSLKESFRQQPSK